MLWTVEAGETVKQRLVESIYVSFTGYWSTSMMLENSFGKLSPAVAQLQGLAESTCASVRTKQVSRNSVSASKILRGRTFSMHLALNWVKVSCQVSWRTLALRICMREL
jgi:hypothetical protein